MKHGIAFVVIVGMLIFSFGCSGRDFSSNTLRTRMIPTNFVTGEIIDVELSYADVESGRETVDSCDSTAMVNSGDFAFSVETREGVFYVHLDPTDNGGSSGPHTVANMKLALKRGVMIRFPIDYHGNVNSDNQPMGFSKSNVGMVDPDDIEIIP